MNENNILKNDKLINNIVISSRFEFCNIHQAKISIITIEKFVYKTHNEVFNLNRKIEDAPKCKCVFTLHTSRQSSYVQIYDRDNVEIFSGNSLWGVGSHGSYENHLDFIKMLHSVQDVKQNYGC